MPVLSTGSCADEFCSPELLPRRSCWIPRRCYWVPCWWVPRRQWWVPRTH